MNIKDKIYLFDNKSPQVNVIYISTVTNFHINWNIFTCLNRNVYIDGIINVSILRYNIQKKLEASNAYFSEELYDNETHLTTKPIMNPLYSYLCNSYFIELTREPTNQKDKGN